MKGTVRDADAWCLRSCGRMKKYHPVDGFFRTEGVPVRVHSECFTGDVLGSQRRILKCIHARRFCCYNVTERSDSGDFAQAVTADSSFTSS